MSVIPTKDVAAIQFFETSQPAWALHADEIGLNSLQVSHLTALTQAARDAFFAQQRAQEAARAATSAFHLAVKAMREEGSDLVATIKAFAQTSGNSQVYSLAQIPMPAAPTPTPPPGQPENISFRLNGSGSLTLKWKAINAAPNAGTFFTIKRRLSGEAEYTLVGTTGEKSWTDATLPRGTHEATYMVQAFRGSKASAVSSAMTVQFGSDAVESGARGNRALPLTGGVRAA